MNYERRFEEGELILVDVAPKVHYERWVPAVYVCELPTGNHAVRMMSEDGLSQVERVYDGGCLRHSDEALSLSVHYELYADADGSTASHYDTLEKAREVADNLVHGPVPSPIFEVHDPIVIDKVVVGGYPRVAVYYPENRVPKE